MRPQVDEFDASPCMKATFCVPPSWLTIVDPEMGPEADSPLGLLVVGAGGAFAVYPFAALAASFVGLSYHRKFENWIVRLAFPLEMAGVSTSCCAIQFDPEGTYVHLALLPLDRVMDT